MEALQKSIEDLTAMVTKMNTTVGALAPLVPSVSALAALPDSVSSLEKSVKDAGDRLQSVSVSVRRLEEGDFSSGSSIGGKQKNKTDDGLLGQPPPQPHFAPPPPQPHFAPPPPNQHHHRQEDRLEEDQFLLKPKMTFPLYDGVGDPLPWINRCELYFRGHNTPAHRKVWMASLHMTDAAQLWYYHLETVSG
ncbi:hypothetical protein C2845_PM03G27840 [Panicum miliaceum]|uniref:Retrotransposon gag domain-containing protein n=1 Tax=Panicum miliaceum TaxID=4540 RepID=A0A3L6TB89_PANMI|nr:hypothetical protein C2845_PM03G27840 [Panicum miliaceum]